MYPREVIEKTNDGSLSIFLSLCTIESKPFIIHNTKIYSRRKSCTDTEETQEAE